MDELIGRGRTAAVYAHGEGKVIKVYYDGFPEVIAEAELKVALLLNDSGLDLPFCYGREDYDGRFGIIYQRIDGKDLLVLMSASPARVKEYSRDLARIHRAIHEKNCPSLPDQKLSLAKAVDQSQNLLGDLYRPVVDRLASLPPGTSVCHGDFHPGNVLAAKDRAVTIDWMNATCGNPAADVARTWLLLRSPSMPDSTPIFTRVISKFFKAAVLRAWLSEYLEISEMKFENVRAWIPVMAAARLREKIPGDEKCMLSLIRKELRRK